MRPTELKYGNSKVLSRGQILILKLFKFCATPSHVLQLQNVPDICTFFVKSSYSLHYMEHIIVFGELVPCNSRDLTGLRSVGSYNQQPTWVVSNMWCMP